MDTVNSSSPTPTPFITPAELAARMGRADAPMLLDVRREAKFQSAKHRLAGALRCAPEAIATWASVQTPREVVVYCVYGHEVGQTAAKELLAAGWPARYLAGGIEGGETGVDAPEDTAQWRRVRPQTIWQKPDWGVTGEQPSRWVTRARPKIDRIACPWLIRRWIDRRAEIFYVPDEQVMSQARALNAIAFDTVDAPITHAGERCSFDAVLDRFELRSPALDLLARIVRGADTNHLSIEAPAAGLLAVTLGMSSLHDDDQDLLGAMMPVYDALYAWCVDKVQGQALTHHWRSQALNNTAGLRRMAERTRSGM